MPEHDEDPQFDPRRPHDCHDYVMPCPMSGGHSIPGMDDDPDPVLVALGAHHLPGGGIGHNRCRYAGLIVEPGYWWCNKCGQGGDLPATEGPPP